MEKTLQELIDVLVAERDLYRKTLIEISDRGDAWSAQRATEAVKSYISNEEGK